MPYPTDPEVIRAYLTGAPRMRAATNQERGWDILREQWERFVQQPVVRTGETLMGLFDEGYRGLMGREDTQVGAHTIPASEQRIAGMPDIPGMLPGFYSRIDRLAAGLPKQVHPNKLAALLKSGASQEEVALRGLPDFLKQAGNQPINKSALLEHLGQQRPPQLGIQRLGTRDTTRMDELYRRDWERTPAEDAELTRLLAVDNTTFDTRYEQYQVPGGENYRETLLTLPVTSHPSTSEVRMRIGLQGGGVHETNYPIGPLPPTPEGWDISTSPIMVEDPTFASGHWDTPNVLLHTRSNERNLISPFETRTEEILRAIKTAPNAAEMIRLDDVLQAHFADTPIPQQSGGRGRFLEEIQSDWHQQGKKEGYGPHTAPTSAEVDAAYARLDAADRAGATDAEVRALRDEAAHLQAAAVFGQRTVPDAPFKDSWPDLALKREVLDVADNPDLEWLGFTTGQTQADRYDLAKKINRLYYLPETQKLRAFAPEHGMVLDETVAPERVADFVGQDASRRLFAQPQREVWRDSQQVLQGHDLQGEGLANIGGEGMKFFYDDFLPKRLEKILKPFGGTVERGSVQAGQEIVEAWIAKLSPEMKAKIKASGLPLMSFLPIALYGMKDDQF